MIKRLSFRKVLLWLMVLTLMAGLVYAGVAFLAQANKLTADAGSSGAEMEMAILDTVKQSISKPVNWQQERALRKKIDSIDAEYKRLAQKAKAEQVASQQGKVSAATQNAGVACAKRFQAASENYAAFWDKNNGKTRARVARETGLSRVKNAEMVFFEMDSDRISAYKSQQSELADARSDYLKEAKTDVSDADRAALKNSLTPRLNKLSDKVTKLVSEISSLLDQIRNAAGGGMGAIGGCAKQVVSSGPADGPSALLSPVMGLLNMTESLGTDITSLLSSISSL